MGTESFEHQGLLAEGLTDESEVESFQISQSAVDELARSAGCSRGPIPLFDQDDRKSTASRVESCARANDTTADDGEVESLVLAASQIARPCGRVEPSRIHCSLHVREP